MTEKKPADTNRIRALGTEVSDTVAANIKLLREKNGWSVQDVSWHMYSLGYQLSAAAIGNMERRSVYGHSLSPRSITVDELVAFSVAFDVAPEHLLRPMK